MLYQTTHLTHFSFPFPPPPSHFSSSFSLPSPFQVEKEMECIVKSGYGLEQNYQQQMVFLEDICSNFSNPFLNNTTSVCNNVAGEDLFVDQLLNLNNEEDEVEEQQIDNNTSTSVVPVVKKEQQQVDNQNPTSVKSSPFLSPPLDSVLSVPAEEADLEWLSQFVEESFSQTSTPYPSGYVKPKPNPEPEYLPEGPYFMSLNLSKSRRSKRARTGGRVWSGSVSDPSSPPTTSPGSPLTPELGPSKKQKKKKIGLNGPSTGGPPRRCSHCGVQKTPQWRAGPMGAKTLCNACGVRFKSGRLLPEYRPACSPTFSSELHSNSHRKVLEMRRKKEMVTGQPESGNLPHPVSSFG